MRTAMAVLVLLLLAPGCQRDSLTKCEWLIADNSLSLDHEKKAALEQTRGCVWKFSERANTGDRWKMFTFTEAEEPYRHRLSLEYAFKIKPPAWKSRKEQAEKLISGLDCAYEEAGRVRNTPLLEVIRFLGEVSAESSSSDWQLVIISDLMQSSKKLTLSPDYLGNHDDQEVLDAMGVLCPRPKRPPTAIQVYWYPGLLSDNEAVNLKDHERIRHLFRDFLARWSRNACPINFSAIEE